MTGTAFPVSARRDEPPSPGNHARDTVNARPAESATQANRTRNDRRRPAEHHRCRGCDHTWTALGAAHCSACHRTFTVPSLFDKHRTAHGEHGQCKNPAHIQNQAGEPLMWFRHGMWRGAEITDASLIARRGK